MGALSDLRRHKKVQDFAFSAGRQGGSFETRCSAAQVFEWLKESRVQVTEETPASLSAMPIHKNGQVGPEVMTLQVSAGYRLPARVAIDVHRNTKPGENYMIANNPWTIPPLIGLLMRLSKVDPDWQPV
jgi:hypothetical protein